MREEASRRYKEGPVRAAEAATARTRADPSSRRSRAMRHHQGRIITFALRALAAIAAIHAQARVGARPHLRPAPPGGGPRQRRRSPLLLTRRTP